jgi:hypothetical protein
MELKHFKPLGWSMVGIFILIVVFVFFFWNSIESYQSALPSSLLSIASVLVAVGLTLLSISYSTGDWYESFKKFKDLGIVDAEPTRKGRQVDMTQEWLNRIRDAKRTITLVGVTHGGWFTTSYDDLKDLLPRLLPGINKMEIYFLNPLSDGFRVRDEDEEFGGEDEHRAIRRIEVVLENLKALMNDRDIKPYFENKKVAIYLYDGTPFSILWIDSAIYMVTYLPFVSDRECPLLKLDSAGMFSEQVKLAVERLRVTSENKRIENTTDIDKILEDIRGRPTIQNRKKRG